MKVEIELHDLTAIKSEVERLSAVIDAFQAEIDRVTGIVDMRTQQEELRRVQIMQGHHATMVARMLDRVVAATRGMKT